MNKVRFEADPLALVEFLRAQDYPCPWDVESARQCVILRVERGDYTAAYVWAHYVGNTMVLQFHACGNKHFPGRWLTQHVVDALLTTAELMSAVALTTITEGPLRPLMYRLLARLGFEPDGDGMTLKLEPDNGSVLETEDAGDRSAPAPVAAAGPG